MVLCSHQNDDSRNTFQCVIVHSAVGVEQTTFVILHYDKLQWSNASGHHAQVGFDDNFGTKYLQLPNALTEDVTQLSHLSNVDIGGKWIYRVDRDIIQPGIAIYKVAKV